MIVLGRILAPYGVQGWLRVHAFGDDPLAWGRMQNIWFCDDENAEAARWQSVELEQIKLHASGIVIKLKSISDRDSAEGFSPCFIGAPREALPKTANDEYYWSDLVGLQVVNHAAVVLGKISSLLESGVNQVLVVDSEDKQRLLPFVAPIVKSVDLEARQVFVEWEVDW